VFAKLANAWYLVHTGLWFIPTLMALAAAGLSQLMLMADSAVFSGTVRSLHGIYAGGPEGARQLLATVAGSMITVAGVTFSITIVALTLASSQFGPRILRNFMGNKGNQVVLGIFISTFLYCVLVLRSVRDDSNGNFVPHLSVTVGVALAMVSLGFLIYFIHHVSSSLQVTEILAGITQGIMGEAWTHALDGVGRTWKEGEEGARGPEGPGKEARSPHGGYLQSIDFEGLYRFAVRRDLTIEILNRPGDFVIRDGCLMRIWPPDVREEEARREAKRRFILGAHRTPTQDIAFGVNLITEIAIRALSPAVNDLYTALMCLDRLGEVLIPMAGRPPGAFKRADDGGRLRIILHATTYDELLDMSLDPIRQSGRENPMVVERVLRLLEQAMDRAGDAGVLRALDAQAGRFFREEQWTVPGDRERVMNAYEGFLAARKRAAKRPRRDGPEEPIP
jgi:uncharacterized membrane protein